MNGFERINNTLNGRATDVVPVMLHNFMFAARESKMTMNEFRSRPENMASAFVECSRRYGLDGILTDVDTALEASAMGAETCFAEDVPAKVVAPVANRIEDVIEQVRPEKLLQNERIRIYLDAIRLIREQVGGELFIRGNADQGPFSLAAAVYGMTRMMMDMTDPENERVILRLIERCYDVHLAFHLLVRQAGADMTSFGDSMGSPDLISPRMYDKYVAPFHRRLVEDLSRNGVGTVCHICGRSDPILDSMADHRFTGVEIDYKTDVSEARRIMLGKSVVFGILDPTGVFCYGNKETLVAKTRSVLETFMGKGLVIGAGCALPAETPPENVKTFLQVVRNYSIP